MKMPITTGMELGMKVQLVQFILILLMVTASIGINVYTSPQTILQPSRTSVMVRCYSNPSTNVRIRWEYGNKEIPYFPASGRPKKGSYTYMLANNSLYIMELRKRNTGEYTCIASSGAVRIQAKTTIRVAYLQQFNPIPAVRAFEGSPEARIDCPAPRGVPKPEVYWMKDNVVLNSTVAMAVGEGRTLLIKNVKTSHAGAYTCFAKNKFKERNVTTNLQVVIPGDVVVDPKHGSIRENSGTEFTCKSKSTPPLPVQWKKLTSACKTCKFTEQPVQENDRITVNGGKLIFRTAKPEDKGTYKCVAGLNAEFVSKNVTLQVLELMKIDEKLHKPVQTIDIRNGKKAKITCQFRGDEKIDQVIWAKKNTTQLPSNMQGDMNSLEITDPQISDAGNYTCTAKGEFNKFTGDVQLKVYESPVFVLRPSNVSGIVGERAWVHCQGEGIPVPSVNYLKDKQQSTLNESRFQKLKNHTLFIKSLVKSDTGKYFCWLTQQYASASVISEFYLTVREPAKKSDSGTPMARTVGIAVGCAGVYILLVIGLMIYCRARRARLLKKGLITETDDGECLKDPLVGNEDIPLQNGKCLDQWEYPREDVKEHVLLGRGKMGPVFSARMGGDFSDSRSDLVVVKEFDGKVEEYKADFHLEVEMFSQLNHDNVVRLVGVTTDSHPYYIITEYSECGDLKQHVTMSTDLPNTARIEIAACIASGMEYLIQLHYIHRDLACRNCIPYPNHNVKVSFLSICEDLYHDDYYLLNNISVPLRWLSPEAIKAEAYSEKSDVWSFGVTMWEIFSCGATPYAGIRNDKVAEGVCKELRLAQPSGCPSHVYEVMQQCWLTDVNLRPTFQQLTNILNDIKLT